METILIDAFGRPFVEGIMSAPHPVVPPLPDELARRRSGKWPAFLHALLHTHPDCVGCGRKAETGHHVIPFHDRPELELKESNIAIVCVPCHFVLCHSGDWRLTVPPLLTRDRLHRNLVDMQSGTIKVV